MKRHIWGIITLTGLAIMPITGTAADRQKVCHDGYSGVYPTVYSVPEETFVIEKKCPEGLSVELQVYKEPVVANADVPVVPAAGNTNPEPVVLKKISFPSVHFLFDSDEVLPEGKKALDEFAKEIAKTNGIEVTGYTCWIGTQTYNQGLSKRRAEAVADYLRSKGLSVNKVEGKGDQNLLDHTRASVNRRVEINVENKKEVSGTEVVK